MAPPMDLPNADLATWGLALLFALAGGQIVIPVALGGLRLWCRLPYEHQHEHMRGVPHWLVGVLERSGILALVAVLPEAGIPAAFVWQGVKMVTNLDRPRPDDDRPYFERSQRSISGLLAGLASIAFAIAGGIFVNADEIPWRADAANWFSTQWPWLIALLAVVSGRVWVVFRRMQSESDRAVLDALYSVTGLGVLATVAAAILWLWSAFTPVTDSQDAFIGDLQRISQINGWASIATAVAAIAGAIVFALQYRRRSGAGSEEKGITPPT